MDRGLLEMNSPPPGKCQVCKGVMYHRKYPMKKLGMSGGNKWQCNIGISKYDFSEA